MIVLSLQIAGRTHRIGERGISFDSATGPVLVRGGLPRSDVEEGVEVLAVADPATYSTDVPLPVDVARLISEGYRLDGEPGELCEIDPGQDWSERRLIYRGLLSSLRFGIQGRPCRIELTTDPGEDAAFHPDVTAVVSDDTWTAPDDNADGAVYPTVFGSPGSRVTTGGTFSLNAATPAYMVEDTGGTDLKVLLAGHPASVQAQVRIFDETAGVTDDVTIWPQRWDLNGREVAVVNVPHAGGDPFATWALGDTLYCSWWTSAGLQAERRQTPMTRAGDILRWALGLSSLRIDWERASPVCGALDWILDGYWDAQTDPWSWIRDQLLPILPISMRYGAQGLYPVLWPWRAERGMAVAHIEVGRNAILTPDVEVENLDQTMSSIAVRYARSAITGNFLDTETVQADRRTGRGERRALGVTVEGQRIVRAKTIDSPLIWSTTTAGLVAALHGSLAQPRQIISVDCGKWANNLRPGAVIELTAPRLSLTRAVAVIRSTARIGDIRRLTLTRQRRY